MVCNLCGSNEYNIIYGYTRLERNNILQCKNCGLVYIETKKSKNESELYYSSSDFRNHDVLPLQTANELYHDKVTQYDTEKQIQFISNNIDIRDKEVLEVGSASGRLLEKLLEYGAKSATGIELDKEHAKFIQERNLKVFVHPIEELKFVKEFDAIVSFHTMEHVYNPLTTIKAIYKSLRSDGYFLGEVPNQNDWRIQIFNDEVVKRFHYYSSHLFYFSPVTMRNYLKTCGFDIIHLETVERYNSLVQLRNILCDQKSGQSINEVFQERISRNTKNDDRLPHFTNQIETKFNKIFERGINKELMGNCLRWIARKNE